MDNFQKQFPTAFIMYFPRPCVTCAGKEMNGYVNALKTENIK